MSSFFKEVVYPPWSEFPEFPDFMLSIIYFYMKTNYYRLPILIEPEQSILDGPLKARDERTDGPTDESTNTEKAA